MWRYVNGDKDGKLLDINGADAELPVLSVTLPEAIFVAEQLNGKIPILWQWQKATGVLDGAKVSPAGPQLTPPDELQKITPPADRRAAINKWRSEQYRDMNLALGLSGAVPVTAQGAKRDVSEPWEIRQLMSNGREWLAQSVGSDDRMKLFPLPQGERLAFVVGRAADEVNIPSAQELLAPLWSHIPVGGSEGSPRRVPHRY